MLTEGFLATLVIVACIAGIGMGSEDGRATWLLYYQQWGGDAGLGAKLTPFIQGSANMIESVGVAHHFAITLMGVFVASFAATTLDSATRLQRYVIAELALGHESTHNAGPIRSLIANRFGATTVAVATGFLLAISDAPSRGLANAGLGGLTLWPIFGATNQLLAALALLVVTVWLVKSKKPAWVSAVPMVFMLAITSYAIVLLAKGFADSSNGLLLGISVLMLVLEIWIVIEAAGLVFSKKALEYGSE